MKKLPSLSDLVGGVEPRPELWDVGMFGLDQNVGAETEHEGPVAKQSGRLSVGADPGVTFHA